MTTDGAKRYVNMVNIGDTRNMTVIVAEKDADGKLVQCSFGSAENVKAGGMVSAGLSDVADGNAILIYVWESLTNLKSLGKIIAE